MIGSSVEKLDAEGVRALLEKTKGSDLDSELSPVEEVVTESGSSKPWENKPKADQKLTCPLPSQLTVVIANMLFIEKKDLPQQLLNRLIRLAAFQNPEFYKAQAMRLSVWDKPRFISCAENCGEYIAYFISASWGVA